MRSVFRNLAEAGANDPVEERGDEMLIAVRWDVRESEGLPTMNACCTLSECGVAVRIEIVDGTAGQARKAVRSAAMPGEETSGSIRGERGADSERGVRVSPRRA